MLKFSGEANILGRACVLHDGEDDFGITAKNCSGLNGCAGNRIACGVIGRLNTDT